MQINNKLIKQGKVLYNNPEGTKEMFTLNDSIINYKKIDIHFNKGSTGNIGLFPILSPTNTQCCLVYNNWFGSKQLQTIYKQIKFNLLSVTNVAGGYVNIVNGVITQLDENEIYITKVVGYK